MPVAVELEKEKTRIPGVPVMPEVAPGALGRASAGVSNPFANPIFKMLWVATLVSNIGTWMQEVASGWLMTTLAPDPMMVSLVQTANTLPIFFLAIPAGALADVLDRRRYLIATQTWMMLAALAGAVLTLTDHMSPWGLLGCTYLLALGSALNSPAWHAVTPEVVDAPSLPAAVAYNGLAINGARALGPALGGLVVVCLGPAAAFTLNAVSFLAVIGVLARWKRRQRKENVPTERFLSAMRVGLQHVRHSPCMASVLLRAGVFVAITNSLWALFPLLCQREYGCGPRGYGLMMTLFGVGAVCGATQILPRLRPKYSTNTIVTGAWLAMVPVLLLLAVARAKWMAGLAMLSGGAAWICILTSFHLAAQSIAPAWVRARAMSVYLLAFFGAASFGSLIWGYLATHLGLRESLLFSAALLLISSCTTWLAPVQTGEKFSLESSHFWPDPETAGEVPVRHGPVLVTVEYQVALEDTPFFRAAIMKLRRIRYRNGVLRWGLFVDLADPTLYREVYLEESWGAHLRQHQRVTAYEMEVAQEAYRFHRGKSSPAVFHYGYCDDAFPNQAFEYPGQKNVIPSWFLD